MSVHIHLSVADFFKMATVSAASAADADGVAAAAASDAAAAARLRQEASHQEETKKLYQMIEEQKVEFMNLKWNSFADLAKAHSDFEYKTKELNDKLNEALYNQEKRAKEDAATIRHLRTALDDTLEAEQDALKCVKEEKEQVGELLESLELAETSKSRATERAQRAEETVRELKAELERMNVHAEEVASEKKAAYNDLVSRFDTSTTFYEMKLEEAQEIRERLEKQLKEEEEEGEEVSRRECALGQRVREATLRAEKAEANFLRLCASIDTALKAYPLSRKELWDHYMSIE